MASMPIDAEAKNSPTSGRLFFLDLSGGRVLSANPDGSDLKTVISEGRKLPDGLVHDGIVDGSVYSAKFVKQREALWLRRSQKKEQLI
jgi:hypothetical protein